jgi:hypothetical protein
MATNSFYPNYYLDTYLDSTVALTLRHVYRNGFSFDVDTKRDTNRIRPHIVSDTNINGYTIVHGSTVANIYLAAPNRTPDPAAD